MVLFHENLCRGCGACVETCPQQAIRMDSAYGMISDPEQCVACGACVDGCLYNARTICGYAMTRQELLDLVLKDIDYYRMSGGGVTFSGGEPLLQSRFIRAFSRDLKAHDVPVLIETCGQVAKSNLDDVLDAVEAVYFDVKQMDSVKHKEFTAQGNERILENLTYLSSNFQGELSVRYPYIPGFNDDVDSIDAMVEFVRGLKHVDEIVFLPYHRLGLPKYRSLGREYKVGDMKSLKKNALYHLLERYKDCGIPIKIQ